MSLHLTYFYYSNCYYEKIIENDPIKLEDLPFDIPYNRALIE